MLAAVGNYGIGKTSLLNSFYGVDFDDKDQFWDEVCLHFTLHRANTHFCFNHLMFYCQGQKRMDLCCEQRNIQLILRDSAGSEMFRELSGGPFFCRADVILLMYAVNDKESFEDLEKWQSGVP